MHSPISQKISLLLKQRNLTIREFEKISGLGKSVVSNIIHGRSKNPTIDVINAIAKNLGCTIEYLILEPNASEFPPASNEANYRLCIEATKRVAEYLTNNAIHLNPADFFKCVQEIYKFSKESEQEFIDERFVKWFVNKFLNNQDQNIVS